MYQMLLDRAAGLLVEASVIEASTDRGTCIEVWTISCDGVHLSASAPRLEVAQDMELTARLSIDGLPHTVSLVIERADVLSHARASLLLRVVSAAPAGYQRQSERVGLAARATLTALICGRIVPNEQVPGQLTASASPAFALRPPMPVPVPVIVCTCTAASWKALSTATCG